MTFHLSDTGSPRFTIDPQRYDQYRALGSFVTGEVGKLPGVALDALASIDDAREGRDVEPWSSESYSAVIDKDGLWFENEYAPDERGRYTLDEFADVMETYWRFLASLPEPPGAVRQYWPDLPRAEAEVKLWEQVWKRGHPYRGRLF
jgi:hypothetical protein